MPSLNWIGKEAVVNHHREVPYHLLKCDSNLSVGDPGSGNLLVQGDNLLALKALLPYYAGQVKCIYIDPPYNTGNEKWVYNDNVNSPEIRKWLGQVVGSEFEDLSRHDKWLCMMYPRLALLREFLCEDGVVFVSIDDTEVHSLLCLMNEVFGARNHIATIVWKARQHLDSRSLTGVSTDHEYVLAYAKTPAKVRLKGKERDLSKYKNPDNDPRGPWMSRSILGLATAAARPNLHYDLVCPQTQAAYPCPPNTGWRYNRETMAKKVEEGRILFPKRKNGRPREKVFLDELQTERTGFPSILDGVYTADGTHAIREVFGDQVFAFPKPPELVRMLIEQVTDCDSLVLDSFAGSGTTGHAVLLANRADGGSRRFICVEMESSICGDVTAARLRAAVQGYTARSGKNRVVEGLGGGFRFCRLSHPIFGEDGRIHSEVSFADLAAHVFFCETGEPIPKRPSGKSPLIGACNGIAYYLLFNGVLGDKSVNGGNVLTSRVLASLPEHDGPKVVYGEACRLGRARLKRDNIRFKQVPYEIQVS